MRAVAFILPALLPIPIFAQAVQYEDVHPDAWYADEVQSFLAERYLDASQRRFRAADWARRAEFVKLVVELNGGILDEPPSEPGFSDVSGKDWFFGYLEEAAREGWVRGDGNCRSAVSSSFAGEQSSVRRGPCTVRPGAPVSRAEAAVLIRRAFGKARTGKAPVFPDNGEQTWFSDAVQAAADHCILRGDDQSGFVRPGDPLNRAEMTVMLYRVDRGGGFPDCL